MHPPYLPLEIDFRTDDDGFPAGGTAKSLGINIEFQNGPLQGQPPNGAFVESLIEIVVARLTWYQEVCDGRFACRENALAITKLQEANHWLDHRTASRIARRVEGTYQP